MGDEVPAKLFGFMRDASRRAGRDVVAAQTGLALATVDVNAKGARVAWNDVALFLERLHGHERPEDVERLGEMYVQTHVWQQMVARILGTPRLMYEVCLGPLTRASFPHLDVDVDVDANGVRFEMNLPKRHEPSTVFFRGTVGELRVMTTLLGLPPARVTADVGPWHGVYDVEIDEPLARRDRAVRAATRSYDHLVAEVVRLMDLTISPAQPDHEPTDVVDLQRRFGLTRMEARVTARLADGLGVNEIGSALAIRVSTVRTHLKRAYAKTGARGQRDLMRLVLTGTARRA